MRSGIWTAWLAAITLAVITLTRTVPVRSQANPSTVNTPEGVTFTLPAGLHSIDFALPADQTTQGEQLVAAYSDAAPNPLQVFVVRNPSATAKSLPLVSQASLREFSEGYVFGARTRAPKSEPLDVQQAVFHPALGAYEVHHRLRGPSQARQLLGQPDASAAWDAIKRTGADPEQLRCVIAQLLGSADTADAAALQTRSAAASQSCGWSAERVAQYIAASQSAFAPFVTANAGISFVTRSAQVLVVLVASEARSADVRATAAQILKTAQVPPAIKLEPSFLNDLETLTPHVIGRLVGAAIGPVFVFLLLGGLAAFLLGKVGVRPSVTVPAVAAVLLALAIVGALRTPVFSIFTLIQCASYLLTVVIAQRPLTRFITSRTA